LVIVTTAFYAALFWAMYLALEPFVRRYWPQTLVSWTTLLTGRIRDPIVGRDVLFGVLLGVAMALVIRLADSTQSSIVWTPTSLLGGVRSTGAELITQVYNGLRTSLFFFFFLFLLRVMLRNQWLGAAAFVAVFSVMSVVTSTRPLFDGLTSVVYFSIFAIAVLRWGLTTLAVGVLVTNLLLNVPTTTLLTEWFAPSAIVFAMIPVALAAWAFYTSVGGRLFAGKLLD